MQTRSEETRKRILQAAQELISHTGYDATGVAEICSAAGVSKGAFYHHFPSKHAVFMELLQTWLDTLQSALESVRSPQDDIPQILINMARLSGHIFSEGQGRLPIFIEFWLQASRDPEIWQASIQPYRQFRDFFASLIQQGIAEGSFQPVDPQIAAQSLVSLAVGLLLQSLLDPKAENWGQVTESSMRLFVKGLQKGEP